MDVSQINRFKAYLNMPKLSDNHIKYPIIYLSINISKTSHPAWIYAISFNEYLELIAWVTQDDLDYNLKLRDLPQATINKIEDKILDNVLWQ